MVVLDVEWLSRLLHELLNPHDTVVLPVVGGGILSKLRLFDRWMHQRLLDNDCMCLAFLACLKELHVMQLERLVGEEVVVRVPHAMTTEVPAGMREAVEACRMRPHGGWCAKPLKGEETGEGSFFLFFLSFFRSFSFSGATQWPPVFLVPWQPARGGRRGVLSAAVFPSGWPQHGGGANSMPWSGPCARDGCCESMGAAVCHPPLHHNVSGGVRGLLRLSFSSSLLLPLFFSSLLSVSRIR